MTILIFLVVIYYNHKIEIKINAPDLSGNWMKNQKISDLENLKTGRKIKKIWSIKVNGSISILKPNFKLKNPTCYCVCIRLIISIVDFKNYLVKKHSYPQSLRNKSFKSWEFQSRSHLQPFRNHCLIKGISINWVHNDNLMMRVLVTVTSITV